MLSLWLLPGCVAQTEDRAAPTPDTFACDRSTIDSALARAKPGDTIELQACSLAGTVVVPAGVTLKGAGRGATTITAPTGDAAVELTPSEDPSRPTTLSDLLITSGGTAGVVASGPGSVTIERVDVEAVLGIGVGAEDLTALTLTDVVLTGNDGAHVPDDVTPDKAATHGLVLVRVGSATLTDARVSTFAGHGALLVESTVSWNGGNASDNDGVGLMGIGGKVTLDKLEVCRTQRGARAIPAYGLLFTSADVVNGVEQPMSPGATLDATSLTICDNENVGLLYDHGSALAMHGESMITGNNFAGILVTDSSNITIAGTTVSGTKALPLPFGPQGEEIQGGDGVQLIRSSEKVSFDGVSSNENERGGLLIDSGEIEPAQAGFTWSNVDVNMNTAFGALCQWGAAGAATVLEPNGAVGAWDEGILRDNDTLQQDSVFLNPLDVVGLIDPNVIPAPTDLVLQGLGAIGIR